MINPFAELLARASQGDHGNKSMTISRRRMLSYLCASAFTPRLAAQSGMASRGLTQRPRPATSGRPFAAYFTDVATSAGLVASVIYGGVDHKDYILEADGCGCAFIDYDNDGWVDIFLLTGTRLTGAPPGTTNRLYKNNHDGTFTDVTETPVFITSVGRAQCALVTTITTVMKIFSVLTMVRTSCIETMAMERLPMSPCRQDCLSLRISSAGEPAVRLWITTETDD